MRVGKLFTAGALVAVSALAMSTLTMSMAPAAAQQAAPLPITQQGQNIKRIPLQKFDVPGQNYEVVIGRAEIVGNASIGRHTHPGIESGMMLEGEMTLLVDGQEPKLLKAGDSYLVPAGAVHDGKSGPNGAKVIATYVVEKGKPLATPAP